MPKKTKAVIKTQSKAKLKILKLAEEIPIKSVIAKKANISRMTLYRYLRDDPEFAQAFEKRVEIGVSKINDLAESGLIQLIQEKKLGAIIFWLKNNHEKYKSQVQLEAFIAETNLSEEQQAVVIKALKLSQGDKQTSLISLPNNKNE